MYRRWRRAGNDAGLPQVHIHDLRHGGLTLAAQSGGTMAELMRRAGHKSSRAAQIYQHAAADRDATLAARMAALAAAPVPAKGACKGHAPVTELSDRHAMEA